MLGARNTGNNKFSMIMASGIGWLLLGALEGTTTRFAPMHKFARPIALRLQAAWALGCSLISPQGVLVPSNFKSKKATRLGGFCLARLKGLEPLTYWFVASHSIQLSYRRIHALRHALRYDSTLF